MSDLWEDEGGAGGAAPTDDDDWDEGDESLEPEPEVGLDDSDELEPESWDGGDEE